MGPIEQGPIPTPDLARAADADAGAHVDAGAGARVDAGAGAGTWGGTREFLGAIERGNSEARSTLWSSLNEADRQSGFTQGLIGMEAADPQLAGVRKWLLDGRLPSVADRIAVQLERTTHTHGPTSSRGAETLDLGASHSARTALVRPQFASSDTVDRDSGEACGASARHSATTATPETGRIQLPRPRSFDAFSASSPSLVRWHGFELVSSTLLGSYVIERAIASGNMCSTASSVRLACWLCEQHQHVRVAATPVVILLTSYCVSMLRGGFFNLSVVSDIGFAFMVAVVTLEACQRNSVPIFSNGAAFFWSTALPCLLLVQLGSFACRAILVERFSTSPLASAPSIR